MVSWILSVEPSQGVHGVRNPRGFAGGELFGVRWWPERWTLKTRDITLKFSLLESDLGGSGYLYLYVSMVL